MEREDLSPEEKSAFEALSRHLIPPGSLENEVVKELKEKKLIRSSGKLKWILYPVAAGIIFLLGFYSANLGKGSINKNSTYMMILLEDENFHLENTIDAAKEYGIWNAQMNEAGIKMTGQELQNETHSISASQIVFLDEDHSNRITGYFLIEASSAEEAIAIAKESPHIKYGGKIYLKKFRVR